jgi:hypothetical protein
MSYRTCEDGLLAIIRTLSNYTTANSDLGNYRMLGSGKARYVVLNEGSIFNHEMVTLGANRRMRTVWGINVSLIIPWRGQVSTIRAAIRDDRQELLDIIDAYPTLNGVSGVVLATVRGAQNPEHWMGEDRNFWHQMITVAVEDRYTITSLE